MFLGSLLGKAAGRKIAGALHIPKRIGGTLGEMAGAALTPYKKGGKVKKTGPALLHKNEFVLPAGVKPTKSQVKKVKGLKYA